MYVNRVCGDDYLVVDLDSGVATYEGLLASQADSNARYNTDLYKSTNTANKSYMVLRKVPRWGDRGELPNAAALSAMNGYPSSIYGYSSNVTTNWITDRAYYIGVFPVTQYQYKKIRGSTPSKNTANTSSNLSANDVIVNRPVDNVSWTDLRTSSATPDTSISASSSGTFLQRLNYKTGLYFDLPTEVMCEIAIRAGTTTKFYWGDDPNGAYMIYDNNSGDSTVAVGSRLPNKWGLYDMLGNVYEWCRDQAVAYTVVERIDAFAPACSADATQWQACGGWYGNNRQNNFSSTRYPGNAKTKYYGFRVAFIAD